MVTRKPFFVLFIILISVFIFIILAEIYLRLFHATPFYKTTWYTNQLTSIAEEGYFIPDKDLGYRPGPLWSQQEKYGFQNGNFYNPDDKTSQKVLLLGDSLVGEWDLQKIFTGYLKLKKIQVLAAGIGGYNTLQEALYLEKYVQVVPDILILVFNLNDSTPSTTLISKKKKYLMVQNPFEPIGEANPFLFYHSALYRFLVSLSIAYDSENIYNPEFIYRNSQKGLQRIKKYCEKNKVKLIVLFYPNLYSDYVTDGRPDLAELYQRSLAMFQQLSIDYVDLHGVFRKFPMKSLQENKNDFIHPNKLGHFIAFRELMIQYPQLFQMTESDITRLKSINPL